MKSLIINEIAYGPYSQIERVDNGWKCDNTIFPDIVIGDDVVIGDWEEPILPPVVPSSVSMRQARLALLQSGELSNVEAAIDALEEPTKSAVRIEWEYAQYVDRNRPFVNMLGTALGLTQEELDQLFILAATL